MPSGSRRGGSHTKIRGRRKRGRGDILPRHRADDDDSRPDSAIDHTNREDDDEDVGAAFRQPDDLWSYAPSLDRQ